MATLKEAPSSGAVATGERIERRAAFIHRPAVVATLFLLPFMVLFLVFRVYAIFQAGNMSLRRIESIGQSDWIGFGNYARLLGNDEFFQALSNTTLYTIGTLLVLVPIPLALAAVLHSGRVKGASGFRILLFLPLLVGLVVVGVVFRLMLQEHGILNAGLGAIGLPTFRWLDVKNLAVPSMILVAFWRWTGINVVYFATGLAAIPRDLYDAAAVDGASGLRRFFHVSVPLSKPIILFVTVLTLIGGFQLFVEPFILFANTYGLGPGRGAQSIVVFLYRQAFTSFKLGFAAAVGVVLALIIMLIAVLQLKAFGFFKKD